MQEFFAKLAADFHQTFIDADRWLALLKGLGMTLKITAFALIISLTVYSAPNSPHISRKAAFVYPASGASIKP